jgi:hypothetical protein
MYSNEYIDQKFVRVGVTQASHRRATSWPFSLMDKLTLRHARRLFPKALRWQLSDRTP